MNKEPHSSLASALQDAELQLASEPDNIATLFEKAKLLTRLGRDDDAKSAYLAVLHQDETHFGALTDLGALALASGFRSAALTAYRQAAICHPNNPAGLVNLANLLLEDGDLIEARRLYESALATDPGIAYAHQGLASILDKQGDQEGAARHRDLGYAHNHIVERPYRGTGAPLRVLLIVSARGGSIPINLILDDRLFSVIALYAEYHDPPRPLPEHDIIFNAVGDADLCMTALTEAERIVARSDAPILNRPAAVRSTGRAANSARLSKLKDVVVPRMKIYARQDLQERDAAKLLEGDGFRFPLLLRSPGYHTGQNFLRVEVQEELPDVAQQLPTDEILAIEFFDARGPDGMARKYRVLFVDSKLYPLHLALSRSWKVHYFSSAMAENENYRREEELFLDDMATTLGPRAVDGLEELRDALGLDYGGADFTLLPDGRLLVFEANATMAIVPPAPEPIWDYRRKASARALDAVRVMLFQRAGKEELMPARASTG